MNDCPLSAIALPNPQETHLWQLYLPAAKRNRDQWFTWLSEDERDRAQRFFRDVDRDRFVLSRGGLRYLLARYLGDSPQSFTFSYSAYGKPSLPHAYRRIHFNLAHSGAWVVYGFSLCQWIGVDVEEKVERTYLESLIQRCLTTQEKISLEESKSTRLTGFLKYWTIKEAHLKALGLGLSYPMTEVQVEFQPEPYLAIAGQIADETIQTWTIKLWYPDANSVAASCVGGTSRTSAIRSVIA
ncbi:4'-phosphopantetheinyl transferase superfamily protein [Oscillatoria sp. CS-180]|uniref:4'-phosphopantetheinyl transferase family protein n=1 Tax=Oscillatoria sp. CS-180 TaxID=3021720 RepID=UPI00232C546C|nr:4'-phosphopantetheinyl transferase superfamily protein [Oscillatoria sp. CS-180]MDB9525248.1 4'-phosphopantetheinyl transferase superfamily protein [Oscillatoria sp. CS-180]